MNDILQLDDLKQLCDSYFYLNIELKKESGNLNLVLSRMGEIIRPLRKHFYTLKEYIKNVNNSKISNVVHRESGKVNYLSIPYDGFKIDEKYKVYNDDDNDDNKTVWLYILGEADHNDTIKLLINFLIGDWLNIYLFNVPTKIKINETYLDNNQFVRSFYNLIWSGIKIIISSTVNHAEYVNTLIRNINANTRDNYCVLMCDANYTCGRAFIHNEENGKNTRLIFFNTVSEVDDDADIMRYIEVIQPQLTGGDIYINKIKKYKTKCKQIIEMLQKN